MAGLHDWHGGSSHFGLKVQGFVMHSMSAFPANCFDATQGYEAAAGEKVPPQAAVILFQQFIQLVCTVVTTVYLAGITLLVISPD